MKYSKIFVQLYIQSILIPLPVLSSCIHPKFKTCEGLYDINGKYNRTKINLACYLVLLKHQNKTKTTMKIIM